MAVYNLGSINIDHFYRVPHLPEAGETLSSTSFDSGLGGKGANMSIAVAKAGGQVFHIGAIGADGAGMRAQLDTAGVDTVNVAVLDIPTGHAIIYVDDAAENVIVLASSANVAITETQIDAALAKADKGDWFLLQNETNLCVYGAKVAKAAGLRVAYAAAPFDADIAAELLPYVDLLAVNEVEALQLSTSLGVDVNALPVPQVLVTRGAKGASLRAGDTSVDVQAFSVEAVDTTGAGDTFLGFFLAAIDQGQTDCDALTHATGASALQVMRVGAAGAIPTASEVVDFLKTNE